MNKTIVIFLFASC